MVPADLLDPASLGAAAATVVERWGPVDVGVHNGRYIGPGHMDLFLETPIELLEKQIYANVIAPLILDKYFLPGMIKNGGGTFINISSAAGYASPTKPAGQGGWGMGYGVSMAAFHRVAGFLATELGDQGIQCFNVQPNLIATERIGADMAEFGIENVGAPADVIGAVVVWLVTQPEAKQYNGQNIEAQFFCHEKKLVPDWDGPIPNEAPIDYDLSGKVLLDLENELRDRLGVAKI
jgi:NAD(P)-dependent dehydrogenase (short-subunit alcohol dehydrogenase family)